MDRTERAVERLTTAHTEWTEAGATEWPPLLVWLEQSVTEVVGRGGGGGGGAGLPFNADALALLNHIDGRLRLMQSAIGSTTAGDRLAQVATVWGAAKDERAGGRVDDTQWENICEEFPEWVARIEAEDDRPSKFELTTACPQCEQRWVLIDGERVATIRVELRQGGAPIAECRNCETLWAGWEQMVKLGFVVGANQDVELLAACGIDLRQQLASKATGG